MVSKIFAHLFLLSSFLSENMVCGEAGIESSGAQVDCGILEKGGACYLPGILEKGGASGDLINHASIAMNIYYQCMGRNSWNCHFGNSGLITITDPSYGGCQYVCK